VRPEASVSKMDAKWVFPYLLRGWPRQEQQMLNSTKGVSY